VTLASTKILFVKEIKVKKNIKYTFCHLFQFESDFLSNSQHRNWSFLSISKAANVTKSKVRSEFANFFY
jgi:hypothetical protein